MGLVPDFAEVWRFRFKSLAFELNNRLELGLCLLRFETQELAARPPFSNKSHLGLLKGKTK